MSDFDKLTMLYDCPTSDTMNEWNQRIKIYLNHEDRTVHYLLDRLHKLNHELHKQVAWWTLSKPEAYLFQAYTNKAILALGGL